MAEILMSGKGKLKSNLKPNLKPKKLSLIKRLLCILNMPIRIRLRA